MIFWSSFCYKTYVTWVLKTRIFFAYYYHLKVMKVHVKMKPEDLTQVKEVFLLFSKPANEGLWIYW